MIAEIITFLSALPERARQRQGKRERTWCPEAEDLWRGAGLA